MTVEEKTITLLFNGKTIGTFSTVKKFSRKCPSEFSVGQKITVKELVTVIEKQVSKEAIVPACSAITTECDDKKELICTKVTFIGSTKMWSKFLASIKDSIALAFDGKNALGVAKGSTIKQLKLCSHSDGAHCEIGDSDTVVFMWWGCDLKTTNKEGPSAEVKVLPPPQPPQKVEVKKEEETVRAVERRSSTPSERGTSEPSSHPSSPRDLDEDMPSPAGSHEDEDISSATSVKRMRSTDDESSAGPLAKQAKRESSYEEKEELKATINTNIGDLDSLWALLGGDVPILDIDKQITRINNDFIPANRRLLSDRRGGSLEKYERKLKYQVREYQMIECLLQAILTRKDVEGVIAKLHVDDTSIKGSSPADLLHKTLRLIREMTPLDKKVEHVKKLERQLRDADTIKSYNLDILKRRRREFSEILDTLKSRTQRVQVRELNMDARNYLHTDGLTQLYCKLVQFNVATAMIPLWVVRKDLNEMEKELRELRAQQNMYPNRNFDDVIYEVKLIRTMLLYYKAQCTYNEMHDKSEQILSIEKLKKFHIQLDEAVKYDNQCKECRKHVTAVSQFLDDIKADDVRHNIRKYSFLVERIKPNLTNLAVNLVKECGKAEDLLKTLATRGPPIGTRKIDKLWQTIKVWEKSMVLDRIDTKNIDVDAQEGDEIIRQLEICKDRINEKKKQEDDEGQGHYFMAMELLTESRIIRDIIQVYHSQGKFEKLQLFDYEFKEEREKILKSIDFGRVKRMKGVCSGHKDHLERNGPRLRKMLKQLEDENNVDRFERIRDHRDRVVAALDKIDDMLKLVPKRLDDLEQLSVELEEEAAKRPPTPERSWHYDDSKERDKGRDREDHHKKTKKDKKDKERERPALPKIAKVKKPKGELLPPIREPARTKYKRLGKVDAEGAVVFSGISGVTTRQEVEEHFRKYGKIKECYVDEKMAQPRDGYVIYRDAKQLHKVMVVVHKILGHSVKVERANKAKQHDDRANAPSRSTFAATNDAGDGVSDRTVCVSRIPESMNDADLYDHFKYCGPIETLKDRTGSGHNCQVNIIFATKEGKRNAIANANVVNGVNLKVKDAALKVADNNRRYHHSGAVEMKEEDKDEVDKEYEQFYGKAKIVMNDYIDENEVKKRSVEARQQTNQQRTVYNCSHKPVPANTVSVYQVGKDTTTESLTAYFADGGFGDIEYAFLDMKTGRGFVEFSSRRAVDTIIDDTRFADHTVDGTDIKTVKFAA